MKNTKSLGVLLFLALIFALGALYQNSHGLFTVLPTGQYNSNAACSFITNVDFGANGENIEDYGAPGSWVSVDLNGDGRKEGYGHVGSTGSSRDACAGKTLITNTPAGLRVVIYDSGVMNGASYTDVGVCSSTGTNVQRFRSPNSNAEGALLTCPTTTNNNNNNSNTGTGTLSFFGNQVFNIGDFAVKWWMLIAALIVLVIIFSSK